MTGYKRLLFTALLCSFLLVQTGVTQVIEEWTAEFDGRGEGEDYAMDVATDPQGNIYVTGYTDWALHPDYTDWQYMTIKYSPDGTPLWRADYYGELDENDKAEFIRVDEDGNAYVTGRSYGHYYDIVTIKYDTDGHEQWVARFTSPGNNYDNPADLEIDADRNVYVTGYSDLGYPGNGKDFITLKYDSQGNLLWSRYYDAGLSNDDEAMALVVNGEGEIYVAGTTYNSGFGINTLVVKYDADGDTIWTRQYESSGSSSDYAFAHDIALTSTGDVVVLGSIQDAVSSTMTTLKYNSDGDLLWDTITEADLISPVTLRIDGQDEIILAATNSGSPTEDDYLLVKLDASGEEVWRATYDGEYHGSDNLTDVEIDAEGDIFVTGYREYDSYSYEYATVMFNSGGTEQWSIGYERTEDYWNWPSAITLDPGGNIIVTGRHYNDDYNNNWLTIKYSKPAAVEPPGIVTPAAFEFRQPYPNPFNSSTTFSFDLAHRTDVQLTVYDIQGRLVGILQNGLLEAGNHRIPFDAGGLHSGVYLYRLQTTDRVVSGKIAYLK